METYSDRVGNDVGSDHYSFLQQEFGMQVTAIVNYDVSDNINEYTWRVSIDVLGRTGISSESFINHSNQNLSVDLEKWLLDSQQEVPVWIEDVTRSYQAQV